MATDSEDVMKFLDGLDDMVAAKGPTQTNAPPTTAATPATNANTSANSNAAVLSFLDELTEAKPIAAAVPAKDNASTQAQTQSGAPADSGIIEKIVEPHPHAGGVSDAAGSGSGWGWAGSLWSTAQATASKVGSTAVSSLKMAEAMVEETLTSDTVKGIVQDVSTSVSGVVNKDTVGKLTKDFSTFTTNTVTTLGDIIAPPIEPSSYRGANSSISHLLFSDASGNGTSNLPPISSTITIWLCAELQEEEVAAQQQHQESSENQDNLMVPQSPADIIHDFVQATANSLWLHGGGIIPGGSGRAICSRVVVNSVTDPSPRGARGVQEAVKVVETTVGRLSKLADINDAETAEQTSSSPTASSPPPPNVTLFLVIQPYTTLIPSPIPGTAGSATALHKHYLTTLLNPKTKAPGLDVVSAVSQSVRADKGGKMFAGKEMGPQLKKLMDKWSEEQVMRVVEVAVNDVLEEFSLRAKGVAAL
ncbi:hypothetical protein HDU78_000848 [Chytriomyces hyalinus]|nr:hypothetical protein HDU78_000848 [Chytriomyces hyalinus]